MTTSIPQIIIHTDNPEPAREIVHAAHPDIQTHACTSYDGLEPLLRETGAEVVFSVRFAGTPTYPRSVLVESGLVKWLTVGGSGTDHLTPWDPQIVTVTNSAGVAADMMAEYVIGTLFTFSLNLRHFRHAQEQHVWNRGTVAPLAGRTILILGLGKTGQAVARLSRAIGMRVLGVRANPQPTDSVDEVIAMDAVGGLWGQADIVVSCVPLLPTTRGMVDDAAFKAMKPGALFVDVSRGGVVDQAALIGALQTGHLGGAVLDVFEVEPLPQSSPLWDFENVLITPHCCAIYDGWEKNSVKMFCENLTRYRQGKPLSNVVDPVRGY